MSKYPDPYHSVSRIATSITPSARMKLSEEQWQIHTKDEITQNAVMEYLLQRGEPAEVVDFFYNGKPVPGIEVPFEVVEYLKKNEKRVPYSFEAYHRKRRTETYKHWLKGEKSVGHILGKHFQGMHPSTIIKKTA